jgi:hypothetical protein
LLIEGVGCVGAPDPVQPLCTPFRAEQHHVADVVPHIPLLICRTRQFQAELLGEFAAIKVESAFHVDAVSLDGDCRLLAAR